METWKTLRENIEWLLEQYKKELELEKQKEQPDDDWIWNVENYILELQTALRLSKKGE